ncbi:hypothetical protein [Streptomyces sp. 5-6(2022)]|uniref:hypothetical protein n=1 Tax=Streptomyces sp. 5-6(2022) TaxID=2936510 RepID=UPI0023B9BDC4|nr:hypothetical protein [Streptomyces sp. 5-6(2022)]
MDALASKWGAERGIVALRIRQQLDRQIPPFLVAHTGGEVEDASLGNSGGPI